MKLYLFIEDSFRLFPYYEIKILTWVFDRKLAHYMVYYVASLIIQRIKDFKSTQFTLLLHYVQCINQECVTSFFTIQTLDNILY